MPVNNNSVLVCMHNLTMRIQQSTGIISILHTIININNIYYL